jgi:A/G-specific adenine glycosylase
LAWWANHQRDLPWRKRRSPYRVWVAEMMLQQTQVATVEPYYRRWLKAFPSFRALAAAKLDDVLKCWEGLGYYSRARNMHAAAKTVVDRFGGRLPRTIDELRSLPGIGPYTAGAIASIAFGADEPVLDGNVIRVLCRLFAIRKDPRAASTRKDLWSLAGSLIPSGQAGPFNEAMMDLGATICTASRPDCLNCPLRPICRARRRGLQDSLPLRAVTKRTPHYNIAAGIVVKRGRALIDRRPAKGLLGGLWEFPGGKIEAGETAVDAVRREVHEEVGIEVAPESLPLITVKHAYSHFRITMQAFVCRYVRGRARPIRCDTVKWVPIEQLDQYAFPRANQKVLAALCRRFSAPGNWPLPASFPISGT